MRTADPDLVKLELSLRLEEYKSLRAEIIGNLCAGYQTLTLTLTAIGVLIAGSQLLLSSRYPLLIIAASWLFYGLTWAQLRYVVSVYIISNHLIDTVEPAIRENLEELDTSSKRDLSTVLGWEAAGRLEMHNRMKWLFPIEAARYGMPLAAALGLSVIYGIRIYQSPQLDAFSVASIALISIALFFYTSYACLMLRHRLQKNVTPGSASAEAGQASPRSRKLQAAKRKCDQPS